MNQIRTNIRNYLQGIYSESEISALTRTICLDLLGLDEISFYLGKDINLSDNKRSLLENTLSRLADHEPIQYIFGSADFFGNSFRVTPDVLIPRPETEELVLLILQENPFAEYILDVGTGSGCIAISLAGKLKEAKVFAWDVSEEALKIASGNATQLGVSVSFACQDVFDILPSELPPLDILVSNPPYIGEAEKAEMDRNVLDWEPSLALFVPDTDPLRFYRRIAQAGTSLLKPGGKVYVEINRAYGQQTASLFESFGYHSVRVIPDLYGNDRIVTAIL